MTCRRCGQRGELDAPRLRDQVAWSWRLRQRVCYRCYQATFTQEEIAEAEAAERQAAEWLRCAREQEPDPDPGERVRQRLVQRLRERAVPGPRGDPERIVAYALECGSQAMTDEEAFAEARRLLR